MNNNIKFSIIIPAYNCEQYIAKSIQSVCCDQTYTNYELIVINDCSTDASLKILNELKLLYEFVIINNPTNIGKFKSINNVLKNITGNYFLILDSDDYLSTNRLKYDYAILNANTNILAVQSKYVRIDPQTKKILLGPIFGENIITYSTELLCTIGYYNENRFGGDSEYLMRFYLYYDKKKFMRKYNSLTYFANKRNNDNLTTIYDMKKRQKYINEFHYSFNLYKNNLIDNIKLIHQYNFYELVNNIDYSKLNTNPLKIVDLQFYKKCYVDLQNLTQNELKIHWKTIGVKEKRLPNILLFDLEFPNFNYKIYLNSHNILFNNKHHIIGWIYLKNKQYYKNWLDSKYSNLFDNNISIQKFTHEPIFLKKIIFDHNIKFICNFSTNFDIHADIDLHDYSNKSDRYENVLFIDLTTKQDYRIVCEHNATAFVLWTDLKLDDEYVNLISYYKNINHLTINENLKKKLIDEHNILCQIIE